MISNRSVPTDTVLPHINYRDLQQAIVWLSKTFGFVEHYRYGNPVSGAQMSAGNAWIMLRQARREDATPKELGFGTQSLTVFIEDIEAHFQRAKSAGAAIVEDLHETEYGELQYGAEDLDGHHWLFSRHARDVSPEQWGASVSHAAPHGTRGPASLGFTTVRIELFVAYPFGVKRWNFRLLSFLLLVPPFFLLLFLSRRIMRHGAKI